MKLVFESFDAVENTFFHVSDRQHDGVHVIARWGLHFVADAAHEVVGHFAEVNGGIHPLLHRLEELRRAHEFIPGLGKRLEDAAANLLQNFGRRRSLAGHGHLHDFGHGIRPDFLKGDRLLRSFFEIIAVHN